MNPVYSYESLKVHIKTRLKYQFDKDECNSYMFGLCFSRPTSNLGKSEILPQIPDWHYRSGFHIDFFFAGFSDMELDDTCIEIDLPGRGKWHYSSEKFNQFRAELQRETTWKYSGGSDLILANARYDRFSNEVELDFSNAVVCQLDKMKELKAFQSIEQYFEMIFQYAEESRYENNTWEFSDHAGVKSGLSLIKSIALSCLPKNTGKEIEKNSQYAVNDIRKN